MTEQKWIIDGVEAPADADIYARNKFRNSKKCGEYGELDYWSTAHYCWFIGGYTLQECKNSPDYQERPVVISDAKWPVGYVTAPEGSEFFAKGGYRKVVPDCKNPYVWTGAFWQDGGYTLEECKKSKDYVERPTTQEDVTSKVTEDLQLTKSTDFLKASLSIQEERGKQYDSEEGERSFSKVATAFTAITGKELLGSDVALIQQILKDVRLYTNTETPHMDSLLDKTSYASLHCEEVISEWKARGAS